jgi:hypothetical protein
MAKTAVANAKLVKGLQAELKVLQAKLVEANKREGKDAYIDVKIKKNQARYQKSLNKDEKAAPLGTFYIEIAMTAKQAVVYVPLSVASGKKVAGFMYQIEGTAEGAIDSTEIRVRGEGVSQVTLGTLLFAKIPAGTTALFEIQATIRGKAGKLYSLVFTRLNYKLALTDARYEQYLKELRSSSVRLS